MDKLICIVGPTGIGKTKLSIELAKFLNTEIINADAIQIYRGLDILSAKPSKDELKVINHHLIDCLDIEDSIDIASFKNKASEVISSLNKEDKIPIVVGGSGLYLKSLLYDYNLNDISGRSKSNMAKYANYSNEDLFKYLETIDYNASKKLHYNNRKRVLRAIEIFENNSISKSEFIDNQKKEMIYDVMIIGLELDRDQLYTLINNRVDLMIERGLIEEVQDVYNLYSDSNKQVFQAIGYKELVSYFKGNITYQEAIDKIKQNSRRYAKKQITWFKNQMEVNWIISNPSDFNKTIGSAKKKVESYFYNKGSY